MPDADPRILIAYEDASQASIVEDGLRESGLTRMSVTTDLRQLTRRIAEFDPAVIVIGIDDPGRGILEQAFRISRSARRPIVMFVGRSDAASIEAALEAGVSAYVVDGLRKDRVRPILDLAVSRFTAVERLREELERTRQALTDRKIVDQAKGILMRNRNLSETEAYALLRKAAMDESRRVAEVARSLVTAARLLE